MHKPVEHFTNWVSASLALSALNAWENEHDAAKNKLLIDPNAMEPD